MATREAPVRAPELTRAIAERDAAERARWAEALEVARSLPLYLAYGGLAADADWSGLPFLRRADLGTSFPQAWLSGLLEAAIGQDGIEYASTSGSSGERVHIARPRGWWLEEHRRVFPLVPGLRDFAVGRDAKVVLTTLDCSAATCRVGTSTVEARTVANTLYLNRSQAPTAWTEADVRRMTAEWCGHRPALVDADPILLALFLDRCERHGVPLPLAPPVISLDYELVTGWALRQVRRHFPSVPIVNLHGSTELGCLLARGEAGFVPIEPLVRLDLVPFAPRRGTWRLVVSSVKNPFMPFLRYDLGDVVRVGPSGGVDLVAGRAHESLPDRFGDPVAPGEIDEVLGPVDCPILVYQLRRRGPGRIDVEYVLRHGHLLEPGAGQEIAGRLGALLGPGVEIRLIKRREILPAASGKFALVVDAGPGA